MPYETQKIYNPQSFILVGAPTITDEGIAGGFSSSKYIKSRETIDCTKPFIVTMNEKRGTATKFNGFGLGRAGNVAYPLFFVQSPSVNYLTFGLYIGGILTIQDYSFSHSSYSDINYTVIWDGNRYILNVSNAETNSTILSKVIENSTPLQRSSESTGYMVYGRNFNSGANIQSTDLKLTKAITEGKLLFDGSREQTTYILPDYDEQAEEVREYYANLLILQYRNKPKARETVKTGVDIYSGDGLIYQLPELLNIDSATGAQLDLIGKILGCPRNVPGLVQNTKYFSFHVDSSSIGFSTVGNPQFALFKTRANSTLATYGLQDEEYRQLLNFKAFVNRWSGNMAEMDEALFKCFGNDINLKNNQDLSITYEITNNTIPIQAARLLGYLKAPLGVYVDFDVA